MGPGAYQINVKDEFGCSAKEGFTILELPKPEINISTPDSTGICLMDNPTFPTLYAVSANGGYDYQWFKDDVTTASTLDSYQTSEKGLYKVEVTDLNGCTAFSNTISVFNYCGDCPGGPSTGTTCNFDHDCESDSGVIDFTFTQTRNCRTFEFTNQSLNEGEGTWIWDFEDIKSGLDNTSFEENPIHTFSDPGFYVVSLRAKVETKGMPGDSCRAWKAYVVEVPIKASFAYNSVCPGAPMEFTDRTTFIPGTIIDYYEWNFGDPSSSDNTSALTDPSHVYNQPGTYEVTLVVGTNGCTDTFKKEVIVYSPPQDVIATDEVECENEAVEFSLIPGNQVINAMWNFDDLSSGDKNISNALIANHIFEQDGVYNVTSAVENVYGCTANKDYTITVFKNELQADIQSSLGNPICANQITTLSTNSASAILYKWQDDSTNPTIESNESGVYVVTVYDDHKCSFTTPDFILEVLPTPAVNIVAVVGTGLEAELRPIDNLTICEGEEMQLNAEEVTGYTLSLIHI